VTLIPCIVDCLYFRLLVSSQLDSGFCIGRPVLVVELLGADETVSWPYPKVLQRFFDAYRVEYPRGFSGIDAKY